ncbi:Lysophospholipase L1 [Granulicella rosea]|uniref:Lysophospholipase L1 n=1 Tax=Granulicella rosea TaxID=474952 RepID=A0A239DN40_9BACT|nr:SGNH/GDSL hydrolase family protein [Granulicella rosea]SNS33268.1 Lysophospholipase L1 [Granulicella rosea]
MGLRRKSWTLVEVLLALSLLLGVSYAQAPTTQVTETVYHADGTAAAGTLLVSWPSFTAASGASVPAGSTSVTIGAGGAMTASLVPNAGATPIGSFYTVVYHLDDGSTTREYWVVPVSAYPVQVSAIKSSVLPLSVAMQTVSKSYVDTAIATAMTGHPLDSSTPYVLKTGDTMTGPLVLPGDPTSALQASDKQYVDEQAAALTAGLAQKVSTLPTSTQTVSQPLGTTLAVNDLNGVQYASQSVSSAGNDGIANATADADCASGCAVVAEPTYGGTEAVAPATWNAQTHVTDLRGGAVVDTFLNPENPHAGGVETAATVHVVSTRSSAGLKATEGVAEPFSLGLSVQQEGLAGGSNLFPQQIQGSVPYFKTTYTATQVTGVQHTLGQHVLAGFSQTCYAVGDCLLGGQLLVSSGGFRDDADEATHPFDLQYSEDTQVFDGTCASGCTTGSTSVQVTATAGAGTQGEGRYLIDTNPAKVLTSGTLTGGSNTDPLSGGIARQPSATFSGTSFPVSVLMETAQLIPTQANDVRPGTVTVQMATSGVPAGFQTNTAALPTASGVACVTDAAVNDGRPLNYEMAAYTTIDGSHLSLTLNKAHANGATVAVGGLCGYGLEQTVDTLNGIRQVFPVVASTSATTLLYAGGQTAIVGVQSNTSAYLNVNASIASVSRSSNVVTVTTAGNLPVDVSGLTLTIAGVSDSSFNGSFAVTSTGPNTFTFAQSGGNATSTGGAATVVTGGYALYPMAEVLGVFNTATKAVDGQFTLAANNVAWAAGDTVEQPHYFQESVLADTAFVQQFAPRPTRVGVAGIAYAGNNGPGLTGWQINNTASSSLYLGNGGTHTAPDSAYQALGVWNRTMSLEAGERAAFAVHCNSHGCGKWNSAYNLFELDSNVGVDTVGYTPTTSTLSFNLRGTQYGLSPTSLTAGTINASTINATTINAGVVTGAIPASNLPVFLASGAGHAQGAVPDPGATASATRFLREDGTWSTLAPALPVTPQCEFLFAGGSGSTWPATVGSYTATLGTGSNAPAWVQGGLSFNASANNYATIPAGCLGGAKTILLVYTTDLSQMNGNGNGFGPIVSSDAPGTFINVPPSAPQQGPGYLVGANPVFTSTDRITGTVAASLTFDATAPKVYINGARLSSGNFTPVNGTPTSFPATTTTWLGDVQGSSLFTWGGTLSAVIAFPSELNSLQQEQAFEAVQGSLKPYSVLPEDRTDYSQGVIVADGDSVRETSVCAYRYACAITAQAVASLGLNVPFYNMGKGGAASADLLAAYPTKIAPVFSKFGPSPRVLMLEGGINDIAHGVTDPNVIFTNQYNECALAVQQGAVCSLTTVPPNEAFDSTHEAERQSYNHLVVNSVLNGLVPAVAVSDWAGDPVMGNLNTPANTLYYSDGTHPTATGAPIFARYDALALHRLLSPSTPYWMKVNVNPVAFVGINSTTYTMPLLQLMPKEKVCGVTPNATAAMAGTGITALTFNTGNSLAGATTYGSAFNAATVNSVDYPAAANVPGNGVIQASWTATGANLSAINAGSVDVNICVVTQP